MARVLQTETREQSLPPCKTAAEMTQICCEDHPPLVCCETARDWHGMSDDEIAEQNGYSLAPAVETIGGRSVLVKTIIERAARSGPCGKIITIYDTSPMACCDQVEQDLAWDEESTPDVLPAGQSIDLVVVGGTGTVHWRTTSAGTFFGNRKKTITAGNAVRLYADEDFCGGTSVVASDGCTRVEADIRSNLGRWVDEGVVYDVPGKDPGATSIPEWYRMRVPTSVEYNSSVGWYEVYAEYGRYRAYETQDSIRAYNGFGISVADPALVDLLGEPVNLHDPEDCNNTYQSCVMSEADRVASICNCSPITKGDYHRTRFLGAYNEMGGGYGSGCPSNPGPGQETIDMLDQWYGIGSNYHYNYCNYPDGTWRGYPSQVLGIWVVHNSVGMSGFWRWVC